MTSTDADEPDVLDVGTGAAARRIAVGRDAGAGPTLLWLGGYRSDMGGTKAVRLSAYARARGLACCRFDYSGHGASSGHFADATLSDWIEDAAAVAAQATAGPLLLVGSSMGAWVALRLLARLRDEGAGVAGLLLLAPAPDFTHRLVLPRLTAAQRETLAATGRIEAPSAYSPEPDLYTRALIEDGARNLVMKGTIATGCPVHIIQGMADPDVPFTHALDLVSHLPADGVVLTLVPGGDHRLSREEDLVRMESALDGLVAAARGA